MFKHDSESLFLYLCFCDLYMAWKIFFYFIIIFSLLRIIFCFFAFIFFFNQRLLSFSPISKWWINFILYSSCTFVFPTHSSFPIRFFVFSLYFFFYSWLRYFFFFAFFHCPSNDFSLLSDGGLVTALLQYCTTSRNRKWVVKREEKRESVDERWLERKR